ncbi:general odorant-binding protein 72-like [Hylaeus volcanicus]|uniref:general odorant-binding protein 72-like n=1 Tax=Hylaeus volcanicus TaxID=313075 RepID=UPI0023B7BF5B|nr:general odorant-binding protein 72-like [Hylaeus volcanicus]
MKNLNMYLKALFSAILFLVVTFQPVKSAITQEQMEKMAKSMRASCLQKIDTTEELVSGIRRGEFPDDYNLQCYTNCIMKAMRSFRNGNIDFNMIKKQIDAVMPPDIGARLKKALMSCSNIEFDTDPCKMSYQYVQCIYHADTEIFFFP